MSCERQIGINVLDEVYGIEPCPWRITISGNHRYAFITMFGFWQPVNCLARRLLPTASCSAPLFAQSDPAGRISSNAHPENDPAHIG